jgi:hypothetical protein
MLRGWRMVFVFVSARSGGRYLTRPALRLIRIWSK